MIIIIIMMIIMIIMKRMKMMILIIIIINENKNNITTTREIHPLEPQRHRHSMLAPRVCAPRVTRCSLGHVI